MCISFIVLLAFCYKLILAKQFFKTFFSLLFTYNYSAMLELQWLLYYYIILFYPIITIL